MIILIESLISCAVFAAVVIPMTYRNPIAVLYDYPPNIQKRVLELAQYKNEIPSNEKKTGKKLLASIVVLLAASAVLYLVNGIRTFQDAFIASYIIWLSVAWFDAFVVLPQQKSSYSRHRGYDGRISQLPVSHGSQLARVC